MTPGSYKLLRGLAIGYEYTTDTDTRSILRDVTTKDLRLVGKINNEIFSIPQWMPSNIEIALKQQLAPSISILQKVLGNAPHVKTLSHLRDTSCTKATGYEFCRFSNFKIKS